MLHEDMPCHLIQAQGHENFRVRNVSIFKVSISYTVYSDVTVEMCLTYVDHRQDPPSITVMKYILVCFITV